MPLQPASRCARAHVHSPYRQVRCLSVCPSCLDASARKTSCASSVPTAHFFFSSTEPVVGRPNATCMPRHRCQQSTHMGYVLGTTASLCTRPAYACNHVCHSHALIKQAPSFNGTHAASADDKDMNRLSQCSSHGGSRPHASTPLSDAQWSRHGGCASPQAQAPPRLVPAATTGRTG